MRRPTPTPAKKKKLSLSSKSKKKKDTSALAPATEAPLAEKPKTADVPTPDRDGVGDNDVKTSIVRGPRGRSARARRLSREK
jgi:hypothetical protein